MAIARSISKPKQSLVICSCWTNGGIYLIFVDMIHTCFNHAAALDGRYVYINIEMMYFMCKSYDIYPVDSNCHACMLHSYFICCTWSKDAK